MSSGGPGAAIDQQSTVSLYPLSKSQTNLVTTHNLVPNKEKDSGKGTSNLAKLTQLTPLIF